ncbi:MAG TPA: arsenic resistance N-acetyltransferase ArsN2 [Gemmatimonadales bacterium]|nr:arsenic resistance N-acetyltransferase ArsN2 [Gemmatimonadales bacterium]
MRRADNMGHTVELANQRCVALRRATEADAPAVERLLAAQALPRDGVTEWLEHFWLAEHDGAVVGVAGVELYGDAALLRSVAVDPGWRGTGLGRLLTERALEEAAAAGARDVYLLTTTAEHYFPRLGFACIAREQAPAALSASTEFRGACPASAVLMHRPIEAAASPEA